VLSPVEDALVGGVVEIEGIIVEVSKRILSFNIFIL
jgi:hypothetical protein